MKTKKVMFINQLMTPYVSPSRMSDDGQQLPKLLADSGCEIRTFMPRWGVVNERRGQLHEVIRLSGMNIVVDDTDHPLIIKVATLPGTRMQVYFIDNDDYFHKRGLMTDEATGKECTDNVERAVFFARGVLETARKLRWVPDVIVCQGWASAITPYYIRTAYHDDPPFGDSKIVSVLYDEMADASCTPRANEAVAYRGADPLSLVEKGVDLKQHDGLGRIATLFSDAVVLAEGGVEKSVIDYATEQGRPVLDLSTVSEDAQRAEQLLAFFDSL